MRFSRNYARLTSNSKWSFTVPGKLIHELIPGEEKKGEEGADMVGWGINSCRRLGISHIGAVST